jgi:hypothetical protein
MSLARVRRIHSRTNPLFGYLFMAAATSLAVGAMRAQALPVIPGAAGYGIETPAGRGGTVFKVTNLNASGTGSLKACVDGTSPRVCVFEVSGTIRITSDLVVRNPNLTIAGQTAPSPGIMIRGAALRIQASDVLVQHIRVRAGDAPDGPAPDNRDSLKIEGSDAKPVRNVVIDHCSFSWAIDETASVWGAHDGITLSNNIFAEPLNESLHMSDDGRSRQKHGYGVLLGTSASGGRVTMVGNLMAHQVERNPLARSRELVFVNNLVYNRANMDYDGQTDQSRTTRSSLVGNVFLRGPSYERNTRPIYLRTSGSNSLVTGSRVYVSDNLADTGSSIAQLVTYTGGDVISGLLQTSTAPVWNSGLTARQTANNAVYDRVLSYAGARPTDRDSVDRRIVTNVRNRTGGIINCVAADGSARCSRNGGGWPALAQNTRRLTVPGNPNGVAANGYTNLENCLHAIDASLQGVIAAQSPAAPASLSAR